MSSPATHSRVMVTGATGAVGPTLVRELVQSGYHVNVLVRSRPPSGLLPDDIQIIYGSIHDGDALHTAMRDVEIVFHLASKLHVAHPSPTLAEECRSVNVEGTRCVAVAAAQAGVRRLVYFSTISVYGSSVANETFNESSGPRPDTSYASTKLKAEAIVLASMPSVVLRVAAVYGPGMKGNYARLARAIARRRFVPVGVGENRRTLIYVRDLACAAVLAAEHPHAVGETYNVTDGAIHQLKDILAAIYETTGRRPPRWHIPIEPIRYAASLADLVSRSAQIALPVTRAAVDKLVEDVAVSGDKLQRDLHFHPQFDLRRGWEETMRSTRDDR